MEALRGYDAWKATDTREPEPSCAHGFLLTESCPDCAWEDALLDSEALLPVMDEPFLPDIADLGRFPLVEPCIHLIGKPLASRHVRGSRVLCDHCTEAWDRGDLSAQDIAEDARAF